MDAGHLLKLVKGLLLFWRSANADMDQAARFQQTLAEAIAQVKKLLEHTRNPCLASEVPHTYIDKYELGNSLLNCALSSVLSSFESIGLNKEILKSLYKFSRTSAVTVRFTAEKTCEFSTSQKETRQTSEINSGFQVRQQDTYISFQSRRAITEYFWTIQVKYSLFAFKGNECDNGIPLCSQTIAGEIKTLSKEPPPLPGVSVIAPLDVNVTWLFQNLNDALQSHVLIDRRASTCYTPCRNTQVAQTLQLFSEIKSWAAGITGYFNTQVFPHTGNSLLPGSKKMKQIFIPVLPVFDANSSEAQSPNLSSLDIARLLDAHKQGIQDAFGELDREYPSLGLMNADVGRIILITDHLARIAECFSDGIQYIETLLRNQLIAAVGKVLTPQDFSDYMNFHNRSLFKEPFQPRQFCYSIRREDYHPEGVLKITPVMTFVNRQRMKSPMEFSINAATKIRFSGDLFLHSFVDHQFSDRTSSSNVLSLRANQFSSFIVLLGRMLSDDVFDPTHGVVVQNANEFMVCLECEQIPTPKTFKNSTYSLSSEQQSFAKEYRSLQLSETLFGICVIQIKPHLEKVLNLPAGSLTKEVQLAEDLLNLFIDYQIPSSLLSFQGPTSTVSEQLSQVKSHATMVFAMIDNAKQKLLEEQRIELESRQLSTPTAVPLIKEGYLKKRGSIVRVWKKRYCVLENDQFRYFKKEGDRLPCGAIPLHDCFVERGSSSTEFSISSLNFERQYHFRAENELVAKGWAAAIQMQANSLPELRPQNFSHHYHVSFDSEAGFEPYQTGIVRVSFQSSLRLSSNLTSYLIPEFTRIHSILSKAN